MAAAAETQRLLLAGRRADALRLTFSFGQRLSSAASSHRLPMTIPKLCLVPDMRHCFVWDIRHATEFPILCRAAQSGGLWGPALLLARGISEAAFADAAMAMAAATAVCTTSRQILNY